MRLHKVLYSDNIGLSRSPTHLTGDHQTLSIEYKENQLRLYVNGELVQIAACVDSFKIDINHEED